MSMCLTATGLCLVTPDHRVLVEDLNLVVSREVTGLVGSNGSGKSTLLRALAGQTVVSRGVITREATVGWFGQQASEATGTIATALGVADELARLDRIASGSPLDDDFDQAEWTLPSSIDAAMVRAGLEDMAPDRPLETLSGGQRVSVMLAAAWLSEPDILLMDEPTNNLDSAGREAVYTLLQDWPGGIVVASHDRDLLARVDRIVALEGTGWRVFGGNWPAYDADRKARHDRAEAEFVRANSHLREVNKARAEAEARADRRARTGKAMRRDGSQPKVLLDAMKARSEATASRLSGVAMRLGADTQARLDAAQQERGRTPKLSVRAPAIALPQGRVMLEFETVSFAYDQSPVLESLSFTLLGGERVALDGPNGCGKTTVLRLAEGLLSPGAGSVHCGRGRLARLDQMVSDLDPDLTAVEALRSRYPILTVNQAHAALAQFDLRGAKSRTCIGDLSGGERLRVGLAGVFGGEPPALLLLDEPTNHLDLDAIEALETALKAYHGTLLAVSHDRAFLQAIGIERYINLPSVQREQR